MKFKALLLAAFVSFGLMTACADTTEETDMHGETPAETPVETPAEPTVDEPAVDAIDSTLEDAPAMDDTTNAGE